MIEDDCDVLFESFDSQRAKNASYVIPTLGSVGNKKECCSMIDFAVWFIARSAFASTSETKQQF